MFAKIHEFYLWRKIPAITFAVFMIAEYYGESSQDSFVSI